MTTLNRVVEMYVGEGTEFGTWSTEYVEIPRDTPDNEIELKAINQAKEDFSGYWTAISINGKRTSGTTFKNIVGVFTNGIKKALTIEGMENTNRVSNEEIISELKWFIIEYLM